MSEKNKKFHGKNQVAKEETKVSIFAFDLPQNTKIQTSLKQNKTEDSRINFKPPKDKKDDNLTKKTEINSLKQSTSKENEETPKKITSDKAIIQELLTTASLESSEDFNNIKETTWVEKNGKTSKRKASITLEVSLDGDVDSVPQLETAQEDFNFAEVDKIVQHILGGSVDSVPPVDKKLVRIFTSSTFTGLLPCFFKQKL